MSARFLSALSRRQLLAGAALLAGAGPLTLRPASASPAEADGLIKQLTGGAAARQGRITLTLPQVAENGGSVPVGVSVDSPMAANDYVKTIHLVADGNPSPAVASFSFSPEAGKAEASTRMRLAKTQNIRALAVMSDGSVYQAVQEVKVTVGGCGG